MMRLHSKLVQIIQCFKILVKPNYTKRKQMDDKKIEGKENLNLCYVYVREFIATKCRDCQIFKYSSKLKSKRIANRLLVCSLDTCSHVINWGNYTHKKMKILNKNIDQIFV